MTCCDILLYMLYAFICHVFFATSNDISDITSSRTDDHLMAPGSGGSPRAAEPWRFATRSSPHLLLRGSDSRHDRPKPWPWWRAMAPISWSSATRTPSKIVHQSLEILWNSGVLTCSYYFLLGLTNHLQWGRCRLVIFGPQNLYQLEVTTKDDIGMSKTKAYCRLPEGSI